MFSLKDKSLVNLIINYDYDEDTIDDEIQYFENILLGDFDQNLLKLILLFFHKSNEVYIRYNLQDEDELNENIYYNLMSIYFKIVDEDLTLLYIFRPWDDGFDVIYVDKNQTHIYEARRNEKIENKLYFNIFKL